MRNPHWKPHCKQERWPEQVEHVETLPWGGEEKQQQVYNEPEDERTNTWPQTNWYPNGKRMIIWLLAQILS